MRSLLLLAIASAAFSADESAIASGDHSLTDVTTTRAATERAPEVTDADLQNLIACARLQLKELTADQIAAVAQAIKHAEADLESMRKAKATPVEVKK